jgi:hypothetical protein
MLRDNPTIDELLGDSLIQAVMRADRVEPQALRTLLAGASAVIDRRAGERKSAPAITMKAPIDRRPPLRGASGATRPRPAALDDPCGSALCC